MALWRTQVVVNTRRRHNICSPPFHSSSYISSSSSASSASSFCVSLSSNSSGLSSTLRLSAFLLPYYCPLSNILCVLLFIFFPSGNTKRRHNVCSPPFYSSSYTSSSSSASSAPSFCVCLSSNSSGFSSTLRLSAFLLPYYCPLSNILCVLLFLFFLSLLLLLYVPLPAWLCQYSFAYSSYSSVRPPQIPDLNITLLWS